MSGSGRNADGGVWMQHSMEALCLTRMEVLVSGHSVGSEVSVMWNSSFSVETLVSGDISVECCVYNF